MKKLWVWPILIALAAFIYHIGGADGMEGDVLGTCHCNYSEHNPVLTSVGCTPTRNCNVTYMYELSTNFGCLMEYIPRPSPDEPPDFIQSCPRDDLDQSIFCQPPKDPAFEDAYIDIISEDPFKFRVCCYLDYCNTEELLLRVIEAYRPAPSITTTAKPLNGTTSIPLYAIITIPVLSAFVLLTTVVMAVTCLVHILAVHHHGSVGTHTIPTTSRDSNSYGGGDQTLEDSGSGAGLPLLNMSSIAGQISLHDLIGKGRYGEVWKGSYKCDEVAVKIFHTTEEASWDHEVDIYKTGLFRHPNILGFIASDSKDMGIHVEHWLIMEYCEFGSLYDLLSQRSFDVSIMLKLAYTAVCGLDHLHTEIIGHEAKPAIVHRDLKSRNIMVKGDYSCCVGDLGLALRYNRASNQVEEPPTKRVGTKRYLAPEIIDESISLKHFESFKKADIYSFGLILWEITMRGEIDGVAEDYQMPYQNLVPTDPTFEDMNKTVVIDKRRPTISNKWSQSELFRGMSKLIEQCWMHEPEARFTSLRLKKSLNNLQTTFKDNKDNKESSA